MWKKIKEYFDVYRQNRQLKKLVTALSVTLEYNIIKLNNLTQDSLRLLGAITLQHNGEFIIKHEFFEILDSPNNKLKLVMKAIPDNAIQLKVTDSE